MQDSSSRGGSTHTQLFSPVRSSFPFFFAALQDSFVGATALMIIVERKERKRKVLNEKVDYSCGEVIYKTPLTTLMLQWLTLFNEELMQKLNINFNSSINEQKEKSKEINSFMSMMRQRIVEHLNNLWD